MPAMVPPREQTAVRSGPFGQRFEGCVRAPSASALAIYPIPNRVEMPAKTADAPANPAAHRLLRAD